MIAFCIGRKEQGKTTLGYHLVQSMPQRVVFDPKEKFRTSDLIANGQDVYDALQNKEPEVIVYAGEETNKRFAEASLDVSDWAEQNRDKHFGFLVDEVGLAIEDGMPEKFHKLVKVTPKKQARIVMTTWRAVEIPTVLRFGIDHYFIFKTVETNDLKTIEERCGEEAAQIVQTLPIHAFMHCDDEGPERKISVVNNPSLWYVDIEKFNEANHTRDFEIVSA